MTASTPPAPRPAWRATLDDRLPLLGHRNWIVVADSAYPWQASAGIETIVTVHVGLRAARLRVLERRG